MQAGGGLFFYGTTLYMSLSQPRLRVSVPSTVQNSAKQIHKIDSLHLFPEKKKNLKRSRFPND